VQAALSANPKQRYDEIQKLTFYLRVNPDLLTRYTPNELITMPDQALIENSDIAKEIEEQKKQMKDYEAFAAQDVLVNETAPESMRCRKCGSLFEASTKQTRSIDEGMTVEIECKKCNIKFRLR
jgi:DNA-directed RNA polymerase subunit M/transcription elongation factor TFIIS